MLPALTWGHRPDPAASHPAASTALPGDSAVTTMVTGELQLPCITASFHVLKMSPGRLGCHGRLRAMAASIGMRCQSQQRSQEAVSPWHVPTVGMSLQGRMVVGLRDGDSWIPATPHSAKSDRAGRCRSQDLPVAGSWHSRLFVEGFGAVWLPQRWSRTWRGPGGSLGTLSGGVQSLTPTRAPAPAKACG